MWKLQFAIKTDFKTIPQSAYEREMSRHCLQAYFDKKINKTLKHAW